MVCQSVTSAVRGSLMLLVGHLNLHADDQCCLRLVSGVCMSLVLCAGCQSYMQVATGGHQCSTTSVHGPTAARGLHGKRQWCMKSSVHVTTVAWESNVLHATWQWLPAKLATSSCMWAASAVCGSPAPVSHKGWLLCAIQWSGVPCKGNQFWGLKKSATTYIHTEVI